MPDDQPTPPVAAAQDPPAATPSTEPPSPPTHSSNASRETLALLFAAAAWLLPGLGHALLKMWGRAVAFFCAVGLLVVLGAGMRGNIFTRNGEDAFSKLGYIADMGAGSFYFAARALEPAGSDVSNSYGDYGTRLLATAGVLNLLVALHAYEATRGRKA